MADPVPQKRQAITDLERRNIRRRRDTTGETQKELIAWFAVQPSEDALPKARYRQFSLLPTRISIQTLGRPHS